MAVQPSEPQQPDPGITPRAVIIGFITIIPGVFWGVYGDVVSQTDLTSTSLMMPPILILVTLLVINILLRKYRHKWVPRTRQPARTPPARGDGNGPPGMRRVSPVRRVTPPPRP